MTDEGANADIIQPLKSIKELQLRPEAAVCAIVHVPGYEQGVHSFVDAQVNNVFIGIERGLTQCTGHLVGCYRSQP